MSAPGDWDDLFAISRIEAADDTDSVTFDSMISPEGRWSAVLVMSQVWLGTIIRCVLQRLPIIGGRAGLVIRADLCDSREVAYRQTLGEFFGGFALLASSDSGEQRDGVGTFVTSGEVAPDSGAEVDGQRRASRAVDVSNLELISVSFSCWKPFH